jgi:hypothetical protein
MWIISKISIAMSLFNAVLWVFLKKIFGCAGSWEGNDQ